MADDKNDIVICTVVTKNYLASARVLAESFLKYHPNGKMYVLLVDRVDEYFDPAQEKFDVITVEDLEDTSVGRMLFWYKPFEATVSMKPFVLSYLFNKFGYKKLIFFDSDIMVTSSMDDLWELLNHHSIILTPHSTVPISPETNNIPNEIFIMMWGVMNSGFIALSNDTNTLAFLAWWKERCYQKCTIDHEHRIMSHDQKWLILAICYFDNVYVLRNPSYNVAYWNFDYYNIDSNSENITINGEYMHFFHFSEFDPENFGNMRNGKKLTPDILKHFVALFQAYRDALLANQYRETRKWPYAFNYFENGRRIPNMAKYIYRNLGDGSQLFGDPFITHGSNSYYKWLFRSAGGLFRFGITSFMLYIYRIIRFAEREFYKLLKRTGIEY